MIFSYISVYRILSSIQNRSNRITTVVLVDFMSETVNGNISVRKGKLCKLRQIFHYGNLKPPSFTKFTIFILIIYFK